MPVCTAVDHAVALKLTTAGIRGGLERSVASTRAAPYEIICDAARGLERAQLRDLTTCQWVRSHHNILVLGPTGIGKSLLANALTQEACRQGFRSLFVRVSRLLEQLAIARASADYVLHAAHRIALKGPSRRKTETASS